MVQYFGHGGALAARHHGDGLADLHRAGLQLGLGLGHDLEQAGDVDHREAQAAQRGLAASELLDARLADPRPLIHVCDRFGFTEELTQYLYVNRLAKFIEVYVQKVAPAKTPLVVGKGHLRIKGINANAAMKATKL